MHASCYVSAGALFTAASYLKFVRKEKTLKANFLSGAKTAPELREIGAGLFAYVQHGSWGYSNAGLITSGGASLPSSFPICFSFNSPPLDSTASRKSWCAHRVVSKRTLSDRIFRVLYVPRGNKPKNGITNRLEGASVEFGEFFHVALLRRGLPGGTNAELRKRGLQRPREEQGGRLCDLGSGC
jgi:hypothetical protein